MISTSGTRACAGQAAKGSRMRRNGRCNSLERSEVAHAVIGAMVQPRLSAGEERALPLLLPSLTALTPNVGLAA